MGQVVTSLLRVKKGYGTYIVMVDDWMSKSEIQKALEDEFHDFKKEIGKDVLIARLPGLGPGREVYEHYNLKRNKVRPPLFLISQHHPMKLQSEEEIVLIKFENLPAPRREHAIDVLRELAPIVETNDFNRIREWVQRKRQKSILKTLLKNHNLFATVFSIATGFPVAV